MSFQSCGTFQEIGNFNHRPGQGHRRTTVTTDGCYPTLTVRPKKNTNTTQMKNHFLSATKNRISMQVVRNKFHQRGLYTSMLPLRCTLQHTNTPYDLKKPSC